MSGTTARRAAIAASVAAVALTSIAACGRSDAGESPGGDATGTVADTATGEIEIWAAAGNGDALRTLGEEFAAENPDVSITVTEIPWGEIITMNQTAVASGTGPDIVMTGADQTASVIAMGGLAPVPDGVMDVDALYPAAIASVTGETGLYSVPWYVETRFLFYRADIAAELGLDAPTTWAELEELSTAYATRPGGEFGFGLPRPIENPAQVIVPFTSQAGGAVADEDGWTFDTPEFVEALEFYQGFFERGESPLSETEATFENGGSPMFISGPWMVGIYEEMIASGAAPEGFTQESVGFVPMPAGSANNNSYIGGGNLGVFASSDNQESSWLFLSWLQEDAQQKRLFDLTGSFPARQESADYQPILDSPVMTVLKEQMPDTVETPSYPSWSQIAEQIGIYAERVAHGELSSQDAAKAIQAEADSVGFGW
ncbi:carbohydrate ABC transporter substrate-binding protein (CUT1 family) [Salana multivorans]|uniref:Carbohydrate ABC transporter substrate-binding protein (CUT1 family) n=1 Tax=Salana multivorans TaxID=120377 RepID=A0A3N2D1H0_9MICO|nr:extracellular solute-binding protein [Salana multivorans]ROR93630.1 carbohydrate ABC transporter substrate-binding protein (CUT1 family) [Salana multivorans]